MRTIILKKLSITAALSLAALSAHAAEQAASAPATVSTTVTTTAAADKPGLTRAQVLEDLKRYQREHANPSYAELVFLR